jgi:hypothetical protein
MPAQQRCHKGKMIALIVDKNDPLIGRRCLRT